MTCYLQHVPPSTRRKNEPAVVVGSDTIVLELLGVSDGGTLLRLRGTVAGTGYLTALKLQTKLSGDGEWRDYLVDDDLDTPTSLLPFTSYSGTPLHETPAGSSWEIALDVRGLYGLRVVASSGGIASLAMEAGF